MFKKLKRLWNLDSEVDFLKSYSIYKKNCDIDFNSKQIECDIKCLEEKLQYQTECFNNDIERLEIEIQIKSLLNVPQIKHQIVYRTFEYESIYEQLTKDNYYILRTFKNGKIELWIQREPNT